MSNKTFSFKMKYIIYASPDKVFEALTRPSVISKWSEGKGIVSHEIQGNFEMFDGWVKGKVIEFKPGKKLSYSWKPSEWDKKLPPSIVKYTFHEHKAGTEIILEHTDFPDKEKAEKHETGWVDYVFEPLNDFFTS